MKFSRLLGFTLAAVAFALAFLVYLEYIHLLGFPDGFITELGYAEKRLAQIFIGVSIVAGSCFIYLGSIGLRKEMTKKLSAAAVVYLILIVAIALIDHYYRSNLAGSAGG